MSYSMTGFARADVESPPFSFTWELRSVNHRYLDVSFRLPDELRSLEQDCRTIVVAEVHRGKLECSLKVRVDDAADGGQVLVGAILHHVRALQERIQVAFPDADGLTVNELLRWPGVLAEAEFGSVAAAEPVTRALKEAVGLLQASRRAEGERLVALIAGRNDAVASLLAGLGPVLGSLDAAYRAKLEERLGRLDVQAAPERLEQELVLVAQRLDVTEEVDRLLGHVAELRAVLARDEPIGRRLDFLMQEMNREANTLGSKSQSETLTRASVELKVLIEQMREQIQNIE